MKIHTSCDTLSIYSFYKIHYTEDFTYLLIERESIKELTDEQKVECAKAFEEIAREYAVLTANSEMIKNYKAQIRIKGMEIRYDSTVKILKLYEKYGDTEVLQLLPTLKWSYDADGPINPQILKITRGLKGLKNQMNIAILNYKKRFQSEKIKVEFNLEKAALKLALNLKMAGFLDTRTTSVTRWCNLVDISLEK